MTPTIEPIGKEERRAAITPAPKPGGIDFSTWTYNTLPERTGNVGWQPDLQDLVGTAINHVEGDYEDAAENCAEQVIERLVLALKDTLARLDAETARADANAKERDEAQGERDDLRDRLHDLVMIDAEEFTTGGGPGFKERREKAWANAREPFEP